MVFTATFSEPVLNVNDVNDFTFTQDGVDTTSTITLATVSTTVYTLSMALDVDGSDDGSFALSLPADAGPTDVAGNGNTASNTIGFIFDCTPPTVTATSSESGDTNVYPIPLTLTFSEPVTGLSASDLLVSGAVVDSLAGSGAAYTMGLMPTQQGQVVAELPAGAAVDAGLLGNLGSNSLVFVYDTVSPSAVLSSSIQTYFTKISPIDIAISFSESMPFFELSDLTLQGPVASTALTKLSASAWSLDVVPSDEGQITAVIAQAASTDAALNPNIASNTLGFLYDTTPPSVTVTSSLPTNTNTEPIPVTFTFTEPVTNFVEADVTLSNCAVDSGTFTEVTTEVFTVAVSPSSQGTVDVSLAAGVLTDYANNDNLAGSISFVYDTVPPEALISSSEGIFSRTDPIPFAITWTEPVVSFTSAQVTVTNGAVTAASFAGSSDVYTLTVTPAAEGGVIVQVRTHSMVRFSGD